MTTSRSVDCALRRRSTGRAQIEAQLPAWCAAARAGAASHPHRERTTVDHPDHRRRHRRGDTPAAPLRMADPKDIPPGWARLHKSILHDSAYLALDAPARLAFLSSIVLAKAADDDGRVSMRALIGHLWGAVEPQDVESAKADLIDANLWVDTGEPDMILVRSWAKWNDTTEDQAARTERKRVGAHLTNHKRGLHDDEPRDGCPKCFPPDGVSPDRSASRALSARSTSADQTRPDQTRPDPPYPPSATGPVDNHEAEAAAGAAAADEPDPNAPGVVALADSLMEHAGILGTEAPAIIRRHVAQALAAHPGDGSIVSRLVDAAVAVGSQPDVRLPVGLLRKKLEDLAYPATGPAPAGSRSGGWEAAWAEAKRVLGGRWRGVDFATVGLPERTVAALHQIRRMFTDAGATEHATRLAFRDAWLEAEMAPP